MMKGTYKGKKTRSFSRRILLRMIPLLVCIGAKLSYSSINHEKDHALDGFARFFLISPQADKMTSLKTNVAIISLRTVNPNLSSDVNTAMNGMSP